VQLGLIQQPGVAIRRVHALVNPASGGVGPRVADELAELFAAFGLSHRVSALLPGHFKRTARAAVDSGPDLIVVLGGDGTARLVAELCGPQGPLLAPLCGGTMNKLGRALYGAKPWREALTDALMGGVAQWMPGGEVDGHAFYCSAVLGSPALWGRAREAIRMRELRRAWRRAVVASRKAFQGRLHYRCGGDVGRGLAIRFICPTVSDAPVGDAAVMEAAVLDPSGPRAGARLALNNLLGDWRHDPDVTVRACANGQVWAREPIPALLDGEYFRLARQVEARFHPHAFRALAPALG